MDGGSDAAMEADGGNYYDLSEVDMYTNHDMVELAFKECDLTHEGRLTYEEFKMWVQRTPLVMDYIESILPYNGLRSPFASPALASLPSLLSSRLVPSPPVDRAGPKDAHPHHHKMEALPHMKRITSRASLGGRAGLPPLDMYRTPSPMDQLPLDSLSLLLPAIPTIP
jgi:hypothetical protein